MLDRFAQLLISSLNIVTRGLDLELNLIQHFALLIHEQRQIEKHLMQFRHTLLEAQNVLVLFLTIRIRITNRISCTLQNRCFVLFLNDQRILP